jgi:S-adenosylmethionine:tRNA ribosyltransferase-isomerase
MDKGIQMMDRPAPGSGPGPGANNRCVTADPRSAFFDYELSPRLIAQQPCADRDQSRLLVLKRTQANIAHHVFHELPELLAPEDLLILNDTKVMPARLVGRRLQTGGKWEGLFLRQLPDGLWELLCQTRGRLVSGDILAVEPGALQLCLVGRSAQGHWLARPNQTADAFDLLQGHGRVPLPPYIRKGRAGPGDHTRYQTVFARQPGAVAAPTAGLHFTPALFDRLKQRGIEWSFVTLHVGLGTFQPLQAINLAQKRLHREWGQLPLETVEAIVRCRARGGRVVAVGTTSARVLETVASSGPVRPWSGETELFIYPPYAFQVVDGLNTNFHLPRTSLLLLVNAFAGADAARQAYETAIAREYRFYSYGDAMLIL